MCNTHLSVINIRLASGEFKLHGVGTVLGGGDQGTGWEGLGKTRKATILM